MALTINEFFPFGLENNDTAMPPADDMSVSVSFTERFLFYNKSYTSFGVSIAILQCRMVEVWACNSSSCREHAQLFVSNTMQAAQLGLASLIASVII